ncbi:MAG TPA: hypothetical protein VMR86_16100 [Myxococcota bacterium]|nr:hypothetical protein [Myxococcota bacterium]
MNRRVWLLVVAASLLCGLFTTYEHVIACSMAYFAPGAEQQRLYLAMLDGSAGSPLQYRVLPAGLEWLFVRASGAAGLPNHFAVAVIALRALGDTTAFVLAWAYFRKLGLSLPNAFIGISLLAWGMSYSHHNTDLRFDSYLDLVFYLGAALCLLHGRAPWVLPLMLLAALNRETSGLIPFLVLAHAGAGGPIPRRAFALAAGALAIWLAVFAGLRWAFPPQRLIVPEGVTGLGWPMLAYNAGRLLTPIQLFAVLGFVPLLALAGWRHWPPVLRAFAWALVPAWLVIHAFAAVVAEARLFLVPQALVFVPGALFLAQASGGAACRSRPE